MFPASVYCYPIISHVHLGKKTFGQGWVPQKELKFYSEKTVLRLTSRHLPHQKEPSERFHGGPSCNISKHSYGILTVCVCVEPRGRGLVQAERRLTGAHVCVCLCMCASIHVKERRRMFAHAVYGGCADTICIMNSARRFLPEPAAEDVLGETTPPLPLLLLPLPGGGGEGRV